MGSIIGGLLGGGSSPGQEGQRAALQEATADYQRMRPEMMQARLNALSNASTAYQGANNALETMWGKKPTTQPLTGGYGASPTPLGRAAGEMQLPQQHHGPPRLGEGNRWEDTAYNFLDPLGVFKGFL